MPDVSRPMQINALDEAPALDAQPEVTFAAPQHMSWTKPIALIVVGVLVLLGGTIALVARGNRPAETRAGSFGNTSVSLDGVEDSGLVVAPAKSLKIAGALQVSGPITLTPASQPSNPTAGQLFFDKDAKQVAYYDGQQFVHVGAGTSNVTNTTIISGSTTNNVLLQPNSPGVQQAGNLNISGTGALGKLSTTVIDSGGGTLYINPVGATQQQQVSSGTPAKIGLDVVGSTVESPSSGWHNDLSATKVTLGNTGGTATSIAVYFNGGSVGDHVQVGLYEDNGDIPSKPFTLLAVSASVALNPNGFTTVPIPSVALSANTTYWLAVNTDSNNVGRAYNGGNKASCFITSTYGFMPDPFNPFGCFYDNNVYSIYLNYLLGAGTSGSLSAAAFALGPTGQALFQNATDSNTAFQVQNASGTSAIFNVDTINGRVGIGKTSASFKLDIAAGDINLSNGRSLRFGANPVISVNGAGTTSYISNFVPGGQVIAQADKFSVQDVAGGVTAFTADVAGLSVNIGISTGSNNPVIFYLAPKNSAGDPTGGPGGMYYNAVLGKMRCYDNGHWHDCSDSAATGYHQVFEMGSATDDNAIEFTNSGVPSFSVGGAEARHPSIATMNTNAGGAGSWIWAGARGTSEVLLGNGDYWRYETTVRIPSTSALSDGTDRYTFRAGFNDDAASGGTDGCYFAYSDNINGGRWQGTCRDNGVESTCDTTIGLATGTWYRLTVTVNTAGDTADFQVDGVSKCQVTTNIPTGAARTTNWGNSLVKELGTTSRAINIDYEEIEGQFGDPR